MGVEWRQWSGSSRRRRSRRRRHRCDEVVTRCGKEATRGEPIARGAAVVGSDGTTAGTRRPRRPLQPRLRPGLPPRLTSYPDPLLHLHNRHPPSETHLLTASLHNSSISGSSGSHAARPLSRSTTLPARSGFALATESMVYDGSTMGGRRRRIWWDAGGGGGGGAGYGGMRERARVVWAGRTADLVAVECVRRSARAGRPGTALLYSGHGGAAAASHRMTFRGCRRTAPSVCRPAVCSMVKGGSVAARCFSPPASRSGSCHRARCRRPAWWKAVPVGSPARGIAGPYAVNTKNLAPPDTRG